MMTGNLAIPKVIFILQGLLFLAAQNHNFFPHEEDSRQYYLRHLGDNFQFFCPSGYSFNSLAQKCVKAKLLEFSYMMCPETPTCGLGDWGYTKPYPPNCTQYIYCKDNIGNFALRSCPKEFHYSLDNEKCMSITDAGCLQCSVTTSTQSTSYSPETTTLPACIEIPTCSVEDIGLLLPYPPDCRKYIYCDGIGEGLLSTCRVGLHFSADLLGCLPPEEANCFPCVVTEPISTTSVLITSTSDTTSTSQIMSEPTNTTVSTPTSTVQPTIPECAPTPDCKLEDVGLTFPYPPDCTMYIYCNVNGIEELSICPYAQHFSPTDLICMLPDEANCPICSITTEVSTISTTIRSTLTSTFGTTIAPCQPTPKCTSENEGSTLPFPEECSLFIYCGSQGAEISKCPDGYQYSPTFQWCVPANEADCPICGTTIQSTIGTTPITTTIISTVVSSTPTGINSHSTTAERTTQTTLPICQPIQECLPDSEGMTLPYPPDCSLYIYCGANGQPEISTCLTNQHFSPTEFRCMPPEEANCPFCVITTDELTTATSPLSSTVSNTRSSTTEINTETTHSICPPTLVCLPELAGNLLPVPSNCSLYIYCGWNGEEEISSCPPGQHFSPTEFDCMPYEEANCALCITTTEAITTTTDSTTVFTETPTSTSKETIPSTERSTTAATSTTPELSTIPSCPIAESCTVAFEWKPYPPNCSKYIYCSSQSAQLRSCSIGQHFSPDLLYCTLPEIANCPLCLMTTTTSTTTEIITSTSETTSTESSSPPTESTTLPTTTTVITTTSLPPCPAVELCTQNELGFTKSYPPDCSKYIYCERVGYVNIRLCPPGKQYSSTLRYCTLPDIANCSLCIITTTTEQLTTVTTPITFTFPSTTTSTTVTEETTFSTIPPCPPTPQCMLESVGHCIPYPPNCTVYFYCNENYEAEVSFCPPGYEFSIEHETCLILEMANCPICEITTTVLYTSTIEYSTTISSTTTLAPTETTIPICPETPTCTNQVDGAVLPFPLNCTLFLYCEQGIAEISSCPPGHHFSPINLRCMLIELANCPYCIVLTTEVPTETTTQIPLCPATDDCSMHGDGELVPYPPDCSKYIYCDGGIAYLSDCPTGQEFSSSSLPPKCMDPAVAGCQKCITTKSLNGNSIQSFWNWWLGLFSS